MEIIWLGGKTNEKIASYLKAHGYIDDFDANVLYTILYINRDRVEIPMSVIIDAIKTATGKEYSIKELRKIISSMFINIRDGKLDEFSEKGVVLVSKRGKRVLSIRVPASLYEKLCEKARQEKKSITNIVIEALEKLLS